MSLSSSELEAAHELTSEQRDVVLASVECGCFHCGAKFSPAEIKEWWDKGTCAVCPKCGIDSVIGDKQHDLGGDFLAEMEHYWFHRVWHHGIDGTPQMVGGAPMVRGEALCKGTGAFAARSDCKFKDNIYEDELVRGPRP
jgi:hypothetical protein